jgi:hypothetical protein
LTQIDGWLGELDAIEREVLLNVEPLRDDQLNWRPGPGRWSIAECLEHVAITTTLMLAQVRPALERAKAAGKKGTGPFRYGLVGGWFVRMMETPGKRPMPAPGNFVPASAGLSKSAVLGKLAGAVQEFRDTLESARGVALNRVKVASSAQGGAWIRLNGAAWLAAGLAHGRRHVAQAERVRAAEGFPTTPGAPGQISR